MDNSPVHKAKASHAKLSQMPVHLAPHPPYSPDLAPSDFFLFGYLKTKLVGLEFDSADESNTCTAFQANLVPRHSSVTSGVPSEMFRTFLSAVKDESIDVTPANFAGLSALCGEFGFQLASPSYRLCTLEVSCGLSGRTSDGWRGKLRHFGGQRRSFQRGCGVKFLL
jgi:hypothetical protein